MFLPAFPASEGNTAREGCPRRWTHSFLRYSHPEELGGVVSAGSREECCEEVKNRREQKMPAGWEGSLPTSKSFLNTCQCFFCSPISSLYVSPSLPSI